MKVVIIGAGATGLAAAYLLRRAGVEVTILEAGSEPGGLLATFDTGHGARLERFYHHFFTHDAEINWLLSELALRERTVFPKASMGTYRNGRLYPFNSPADLLRFDAIGLGGRLRFAFSSAMLAYLKGPAEREDLAAMAWFERWAGRQATEAIWRPMLRIKFGAAADRISLAWMAGRLRQRTRSRKQGEERLGYLQGSLQVLVDTWTADLTGRGVELQLECPVQALLTEGPRVVGVSTPRGELRADAVVSTVPTEILARLVQPVRADYAEALSQIEYMNAMCTILALKEPLSDTYWINVADPGFDFGGVIEQTNIISPEVYGGQHLVYLSRYLTSDDPLWGLSDEALLKRHLEQLGRLYGRDVAALVMRSWIFRGRHAAPITDVGFHTRIPTFRTPLDGLFLACMCHIYPDERSVNNSVRVAAELVRAMGFSEVADSVPRGLSLSAKYGAAPVGTT